MKYLVTGSAGFIGFHLCKMLLERGETVIGIDEMNHYYDQQLKHDRNSILCSYDNYDFRPIPIQSINDENQDIGYVDYIVHLAAYSGIQHSIENPLLYEYNNCYGTLCVLEFAKKIKPKKFLFTSSSCVYGEIKSPCTESKQPTKFLNMYALSKRHNEMQIETYKDLTSTCLRLFTVYGPYGRPDSSIYKWVKALYDGEDVRLNGQGRMKREYTYIDDVINAIDLVLLSEQKYNKFEIYNVGNTKSIDIGYVVDMLEKITGLKAKRKHLPYPEGEIVDSFADTRKIAYDLGYRQTITLKEGLKRFVDWYKPRLNVREIEYREE